MGMDYKYAGSSSYPRFDRELCEIAQLIGAIETDHLEKRRKTEDSRPFGHWFGYLSSDGSDKLKFAIPETIPGAVAKWLNKPYEAMTPEETKLVWDVLSDHPKAREISPQICKEFENLVRFGEGWDIS